MPEIEPRAFCMPLSYGLVLPSWLSHAQHKCMIFSKQYSAYRNMPTKSNVETQALCSIILLLILQTLLVNFILWEDTTICYTESVSQEYIFI